MESFFSDATKCGRLMPESREDLLVRQGFRRRGCSTPVAVGSPPASPAGPFSPLNSAGMSTDTVRGCCTLGDAERSVLEPPGDGQPAPPPPPLPNRPELPTRTMVQEDELALRRGCCWLLVAVLLLLLLLAEPVP